MTHTHIYSSPLEMLSVLLFHYRHNVRALWNTSKSWCAQEGALPLKPGVPIGKDWPHNHILEKNLIITKSSLSTIGFLKEFCLVCFWCATKTKT